MPKKKMAKSALAGTSKTWFHPGKVDQSARGRRSIQHVRNRAVWRVYTNGTGDVKMRSQTSRRSPRI
jgi:hypothetical protein